jgi:hypothetical protein
MGNDKNIEQLVAVVDEMRELCAVIRQNTVLAKTMLSCRSATRAG